MAETIPTDDIFKYLDVPLLHKSPYPLEGQTVLITGATRLNGIGFAIAERFALERMRVFIVGTKASEHIAPYAVERLRAYGGEAYSFVGDITQEESCKRIMAEACQIANNRIDVLINNAGTNRNKALPAVTLDDWDYIMDPKAKGTFLMTREWFNVRNRRQIMGGNVLIISSPIGIYGGFGQAPYGAANGAVLGFGQEITHELGSRGVRINIIVPTFTEGTDMTEGIDVEGVRIVTPIGEVAVPQDIAGAAAFLVGPDAAKISGLVLPVDGGVKSNYTALLPLYRKGFRQVPKGALELIEGGITQEEIDAAMEVRRQRLKQGGS